LHVEFTGLKPGAKVQVETLDRQNGNALAAWEELGQPDHLSRAQTERLREQAAATKRESFAADGNGSFKWQRRLEPWSVVLIKEL
jgi:xylan 1,4-beta-xylosidase